MEDAYDVVVVGGGAAGLSAALALSRARRSVLVVDAGAPRNAPADGVHNYLGREGSNPADLLADGRAEVAGYGGEVVTGTVVAARRLADAARDGATHDGAAHDTGTHDEGAYSHEAHDGPAHDAPSEGLAFRVELADGSMVDARRLLVATGLVDELPDVPGLAERWGRDVLHCPYCHGWEVRDQAVGVLGTGPLAVHQAQMFRQWSDDVTLFVHTAPPPTEDEREQLDARGIRVVEGEVAAVEVTDDRISGVRLRSGEVVPRQAVVVGPRFAARDDVLGSLGLTATSQEMAGHVIGTAVAADPSGATAVPGVRAAGNVTDLRAQVVSSAAAGLNVGAAINADLVAEDIARAVAARHRTREAQEFWDGLYRQNERIWSGRPNAAFVREASDLEPGSALDLGSGEGGDAVWLAGRGWRVVGVDISPVALERAAAHAAEAGVADRIDWQRHDLAVSFPAGTFDLVSAQFLHSYLELPREEILRAAAAAVSPGGALLVVGHAGPPSWDPHQDHGPLPTPQDVLDALRLPDGEWEVLRSDEHRHELTGPDGEPAWRTDNTLLARRLPSAAPARPVGDLPDVADVSG